jgi:hypothetical protein
MQQIYEKQRNTQMIVVGRPEGKKEESDESGRLNIMTDHRELEWDGMDWIYLARIGTSGGLL